jgi:hypothetical protein
VTAALSPVARALLAWLQERPAAGEGSLKSWGQGRRPQLTLTQVEVRAAELVEANLVTREIKADGRAVYRAATLAPRAEPAPVEVTTDLTTLHAWGQELLAHLRTVPKASIADLAAWGLAHAPSLELHQVEGLVDELVKSKKVTFEASRSGNRRVYRAVPAQVVTEPGWIPRTDNAGPFYAIDRSPEPAPCARCDQLAEALLSWERLWGVDGTDLAAMEKRIVDAERERDEAEARANAVEKERDILKEDIRFVRMNNLSANVELGQVARRLAAVEKERDEAIQVVSGLAQVTTPEPPPSLSPNALGALAILSTTRGADVGEIATRSRILRRSVPHALAELRAAGVAVESTPGLWRRR